MTNDQLGKSKFESLLQQKGISDYKFTKEIYNRLDCYYKVNDLTVGVEIKNRNEKDEHFPDYIMEIGKYNAMQERINDNKIDTAQMVYFFGNTMYVFNFTMIRNLYRNKKIQPVLAKLPNSNENYSHDVQKYIFYLPKQYAFKYQLIDGEWKQTQKPKREL